MNQLERTLPVLGGIDSWPETVVPCRSVQVPEGRVTTAVAVEDGFTSARPFWYRRVYAPDASRIGAADGWPMFVCSCGQSTKTWPAGSGG